MKQTFNSFRSKCKIHCDYVITVSMCGVDSVYRLKLHRTEIKMQCFPNIWKLMY